MFVLFEIVYKKFFGPPKIRNSFLSFPVALWGALAFCVLFSAWVRFSALASSVLCVCPSVGFSVRACMRARLVACLSLWLYICLSVLLAVSVC